MIYAQSIANGNLVVVATSDQDYNARVAFSMLSQVSARFQDQFKGKWESADHRTDNFITWPELDRTLAKYQDPTEADQILKIQKDIEETKIIMHTAIDQVLERGEKIDNLVAISGDLSTASKSFYKSAKKTNSSCCVVS